MPHLPARSFVLLALALVLAAPIVGCATTERATTEGRDAHTIRGDFGELDVQGALTVGEEATLVVSPRLTERQTLAALSFRGEAGTFVKIEVSAADGAEGSAAPSEDGARTESAPEVVLLEAQGPTRATVVSHGRSPSQSILWFKLLRTGTHYVVAKDTRADASAPAGARHARVLVTEVLAPVARL